MALDLSDPGRGTSRVEGNDLDHDCPVTLDEVADELYGLPLDEFTEARNTRAKEAAAVGDRALATAIRKLKKPLQTAALLNTFVREHPREIEEIRDLGREFRRAQDAGQGDAIRRLSTSRQTLIQGLLRLASEDARASGRPFGPEAQRQVAATLEAAMADDGAGAALRAARLTEPLSYIGFGGEPESHASSSESRRPSRRSRGAERAIAEVQRTLVAADATLEEARRRYEEADDRRRRIAGDLREAERTSKKCEAELHQARAVRRKAADRARATKQGRR